jgi:hypothetical protein
MIGIKTRTRLMRVIEFDSYPVYPENPGYPDSDNV